MNSKKPLVLILCGGRSLRLWPLSKYKSKNFLNLFGFSPLELTIKRFLKVTSKENIFLIANAAEKKALRKLKLVKPSNVFFEPASKNTAAAILLSILYLQKHSSRNVIISPVDHLIENKKAFYQAINKALKAAQKGLVCTLGIKPTAATPDFGYIQVKHGSQGIYPIKRFIEKPKIARAKKLIAKGNCFYNSGIFISSLDVLRAEYKKYYTGYNNFIRLLAQKRVAALYRNLPNIPFDKAIMEKTKKGALVKGNFSWKDFGSWLAVYQALAKDKKGNTLRAKSYLSDSSNNFIFIDNPQKKLLAIGIEDSFVVDSKDFILLAKRSRINELKAALKKFKL